MSNNKAQKRKDIDELEKSYQTIAEQKQGKYAKRSQKSKGKVAAIICSAVLVICILGGIAGYFIYTGIRDSRTFETALTIAGVQVEGQTRKDAIAAVQDAFSSNHQNNTLTVTVGQHTVKLTPEITKITLDAKAAVDAALKASSAANASGAFDISKFVKADRGEIMAQLEIAVADVESQLKQHSYSVSGTLPADILTPAEGEGQTLTVVVGTPGIDLDTSMLYDAVLTALAENVQTIDYAFPVTEPDELDYEAVYQEVCIPVVDAVLDPETFEISDEATGYGFLPDELKELMASAKPGETVELPFKTLHPEHTKEVLEANLYKDVLGEMSASAGYNYDRNINLRIACERINGIVLMPGDVFSYNYALGERNAANGWRPGASYVGGQVVQTYGGGICQVSSVLYYATVLADLEIVERDCHAYLPSYIPYATDATVAWGGIDYKFKNNTEYPIKIEATADGSYVRVRLLGTDTRDYYVKFISETLEWLNYKTSYKEIPEEDNPNGYKDGQWLTDPCIGAVARSFRNKYDKETNELISSVQENYDTYYTRELVIAKIIKKEVPTEPPSEGSTDDNQETPGETPIDPPADDPDDTPVVPLPDPPGGNVGEDNGSVGEDNGEGKEENIE